MKKQIISFLTVFILLTGNAQKNYFKPNTVSPSPSMVDYQAMELVGFVHFNMNTFTDKEWGYGDESEQTFNPTKLNVEQWVKVLKFASRTPKLQYLLKEGAQQSTVTLMGSIGAAGLIAPAEQPEQVELPFPVPSNVIDPP